MKPLGDGFIKLIKMIIAPIIFCTVVVGIAGMEDMKKVGKTGGLAVLYFEVVSSIALVIGLIVVNLWQPGVGMNVDPSTLDTKGIAKYAAPGKMLTTTEFLLNIIPTSVVDAFAKGDMLQVLFFSILFGYSMHAFGERGKPVFDLIEKLSHVLFGIVGVIMKVAPIGAFGAMAYTIGKHGLGSLTQLASLMGAFYLTCVVFIFGVLGSIAAAHGFSIWKLIKYIKEELFLVLGTSSSESALPRLMAKMENAGAAEIGRRPGRADGLLLQPRRHLDLPHHGRRVHCPGDQYADDPDAAGHAAGHAAADLQGRRRRHRQRLHRAGGHAVRRWHRAGCRPGADSRHRPLHVRSAGADQHHR